MIWFHRYKAGIGSVSTPTFNWANINTNSRTSVWVNGKKTIALSLNYFNLNPDIPTVKDIDTIRNFYKTMVSKADGGIIEIDLITIREIPAVKTIFKFANRINGITYIGSITIPFEKHSYVIKIQAVEAMATGIRESVVTNILNDYTLFGNGLYHALERVATSSLSNNFCPKCFLLNL